MCGDGTSKTELSKYPEKVRALWNRRVDWSAQVREHQPVSREDIDRLLLDKLPEVLSHDQKLSKIHNLISSLSGKAIRNAGTRPTPSIWTLAPNIRTNEHLHPPHASARARFAATARPAREALARPMASQMNTPASTTALKSTPVLTPSPCSR
jgi:hypothetical protein